MGKIMNNPKEIKRQNYLSFFKDGVYDAIIKGEKDPKKNFSDYYKQGYKHGTYVYETLLIKEIPYG
jgi:hypothetical protein